MIGDLHTPVRVFVVWEPVLDTDSEPPGRSALSTVTGRNVAHFWDPNTRLSAALKASSLDFTNFRGKPALVQEEIVWDFVGVFPKGLRWESEAPPPDFMAAPVIDYVDALKSHLNKKQL